MEQCHRFVALYWHLNFGIPIAFYPGRGLVGNQNFPNRFAFKTDFYAFTFESAWAKHNVVSVVGVRSVIPH